MFAYATKPQTKVATKASSRNRCVQRTAKAKADDASPLTRLPYWGSGPIPSKLQIGKPVDALEREADRVADRVMRMPESTVWQRGVLPEKHVQPLPSLARSSVGLEPAPQSSASVRGLTLRSGADPMSGLSTGRPLTLSERSFFEPRFKQPLHGVRLHDDSAAHAVAKAFGAKAFCLGQDIVFARGEYQPGSEASRKLLAHELAHTIQQGSSHVIRRTCGDCRTDWETIVGADHDRALTMLDNTIARIASYDGTNPPDVKAALERRFKASSNGFAAWVNLNLRLVRLLAPLAGYKCQLSTCGLCNEPGRYGWSPWCVPFTDIRVCDPVYFAMNDRRRSMGLVHEWVHKYGCNFDFGYCDQGGCPGGTTRSLFNADPWAKLVLDLG